MVISCNIDTEPVFHIVYIRTLQITGCDLDKLRVLFLLYKLLGGGHPLGRLENKTRPSTDSEAATMYKQKRQSLNMQTGQGFK